MGKASWQGTVLHLSLARFSLKAHPLEASMARPQATAGTRGSLVLTAPAGGLPPGWPLLGFSPVWTAPPLDRGRGHVVSRAPFQSPLRSLGAHRISLPCARYSVVRFSVNYAS